MPRQTKSNGRTSQRSQLKSWRWPSKQKYSVWVARLRFSTKKLAGGRPQVAAPWVNLSGANCSTPGIRVAAAFVWALQVHAQKRFSTTRSVRRRLKNAAPAAGERSVRKNGCSTLQPPSILRVSVGASGDQGQSGDPAVKVLVKRMHVSVCQLMT